MFDHVEEMAHHRGNHGTDQERDDFVRDNFSQVVLGLIARGAPEADAVDATQQAMIITLRKWPHDAPQKFVRIVAHGAWVDQVRASVRAQKAHERLAARHDVPAPAADATVLFDAETTYVLDLLSQLPPQQRAVMAFKLDERTDDEIAELTGQKPATVRSNLRHARIKLKQLLRDRKE